MIALVLLASARAATLQTCGDAPVEGCWPTLQAAVDAAVDDDVIVVTGGRYAESIAVVGKRLSLQADGDAVVSGAGDGSPSLAVWGGGSVASVGVSVASDDARAVEVLQDGDLTLERALVGSSTIQTLGGAVLVYRGTFQADDCIFGPASASGSGGHIYVESGVVRLFGSLLYGGLAAESGGSIGGFRSLVVAEYTEFRDNFAARGGAISMVATASTEGITTSWAKFYDNAATYGGGAIWVDGNADGLQEVFDSLFQGNDGRQGPGGAIRVASDELRIRRSTFCDNRTDFWWGAAVAHEAPKAPTTIRNSLFFEHDGTAIYVSNGVGSPGVELVHDHFVGLTSTSAPVLYVDRAPLLFSDNLVAYTRTTASSDDEAQPLRVDPGEENRLLRTVWWSNEGGQPQAGLEGEHWFEDPLLYSWQRDDRCLFWNEEGRTRWRWPGRDVGPDTDRDGSPGDAGAFGGPEAWSGLWSDADDDGTLWLYDCDDDDPGFAVDAGDEPYDGFDNDCDGWSDHDADRDGHDREPEGGDCADADPTRHPDAEEIAYDGVDQDCDDADLVDVDGDGYTIAHDCDDRDATVNPGAVDDDPSRDLDCDGLRDIPKPLAPGCGRGAGAFLLLLPWWRRRGSRGIVRA